MGLSLQIYAVRSKSLGLNGQPNATRRHVPSQPVRVNATLVGFNEDVGTGLAAVRRNAISGESIHHELFHVFERYDSILLLCAHFPSSGTLVNSEQVRFLHAAWMMGAYHHAEQGNEMQTVKINALHGCWVRWLLPLLLVIMVFLFICGLRSLTCCSFQALLGFALRDEFAFYPSSGSQRQNSTPQREGHWQQRYILFHKLPSALSLF